ncbi:MAG: hypothetical protein ABIG39_01565 [Candidatus Micrarchaeota archaeon]
MVRAVGMFSGGLDSSLAIKIIQEQGIEVIGLHFESPFCSCGESGCLVKIAAKELEMKLMLVDEGMEFIRMIRKPKHGYGSAINPCIDCRIHRLRKAKRIAKKLGASFIFTGEVLGQRPMSQHMRSLRLIEKEAGLVGKLLRPLSAKVLSKTEAEKNGLVDREKLLGIHGRRRIIQMELAKRYGLNHYQSPGGGCPLTEKAFAKKLRDLFKHRKRLSMNEVLLLKYGRHFRIGKNKVIVGRNKRDNEVLLLLKGKWDYAFEVPDIGSPITILRGPKGMNIIWAAASLTARYSDSKDENVRVDYWRTKKRSDITVSPAAKRFCDEYMLTTG